MSTRVRGNWWKLIKLFRHGSLLSHLFLADFYKVDVEQVERLMPKRPKSSSFLIQMLRIVNKLGFHIVRCVALSRTAKD